MGNTKIYFDESGFTGARLLDKGQPIFAYSSIRMNDEQAKNLVANFKSVANELKFSTIKSSPTKWKYLKELLCHPNFNKDTVSVAVYHKKYLNTVHIVDRLIEYVCHNDGIDLYKEGANIALTNLIYGLATESCNEIILEKFRFAFQEMFKNRTEDSICKFYYYAVLLFDTCKSEPFQDLLIPILVSSNFIQEIFKGTSKFDLDPSFSGLMCLIDYWTRSTNERFDLIIDPSKPIEHLIGMVNELKDVKENIEIGYDRRKFKLPLPVDQISFGDSKSSLQIQLADLMAGATAYYCNCLIGHCEKDNLFKILEESDIERLMSHKVWPHMAVTPEELNTIDDGLGTNPLDEIVRLTDKKEKL